MYLLPRIFTEDELVIIDGDDAQVQKWRRRHGDASIDEANYSTQDMSDNEQENEPCRDVTT
jgi:hypothetical protein